MAAYRILLDADTARFYQQVACCAGISTEQVLSDALFRLAGELALEALSKTESR